MGDRGDATHAGARAARGRAVEVRVSRTPVLEGFREGRSDDVLEIVAEPVERPEPLLSEDVVLDGLIFLTPAWLGTFPALAAAALFDAGGVNVVQATLSLVALALVVGAVAALCVRRRRRQARWWLPTGQRCRVRLDEGGVELHVGDERTHRLGGTPSRVFVDRGPRVGARVRVELPSGETETVLEGLDLAVAEEVRDAIAAQAERLGHRARTAGGRRIELSPPDGVE